MKTWTKSQVISRIILLTILIIHFSRSVLVLIYDDLLPQPYKQVHADQFTWWLGAVVWLMFLGEFPLIAFVIKLNQRQLSKMNIDKPYVAMLVIVGLIQLYVLPYNVLAIAALVYLVYILFSNKAEFGKIDNDTFRMLLLIVGGYALILPCIVGFVENATLGNFTADSLLGFVVGTIPDSIIEEVIFRGMLYMFLMDLGLNQPKVFFVQAFLFWIRHINSMFSSPVFFWITLPILSLVLGYIVFRSKSITPSAIAHILYNTVARFVVF